MYILGRIADRIHCRVFLLKLVNANVWFTLTTHRMLVIEGRYER